MPAPSVARLRCEYRLNPLGTDVADPRLSWLASSERSGARQRAARIRVASTLDGLVAGDADLWDPGWIIGADPVQVYAGDALASATRAHWTVAVEDEMGERSDWGEPAWWETGLLDASDWTAQWITAPSFAVPYLRREVEITAPVVSARLSVTAMGLYRASINGRRVGDDWFRPGWTDYHTRLQVQTYDVTDHLRVGTNALGLVLADGWYAGPIGWLGERGHYGQAPQVLAQLTVDRNDGTSTVFGTDDGWEVRAGPIVRTDFLTGEHHDARLQRDGWDEPGYRPQWMPSKPAVVVTAPGAKLVSSAAEPVRITEEIAIHRVAEPAPGTFVLDVGQNIVGWARVVVEGQRGDLIRLRFAEMVQPDGHLYTDNLRLAQAEDHYICRGDGTETWEPSFTFHGFRYIEVTGWPGGGPPPVGSVTAVVAHSELDRTGELSCSEPMVNQLVANIDWGLRSNFVEVPTDCPQRDERLGWLGDIQVFAATACFTRDVAAFVTKWMGDVADAQTSEGAFPDVAPKVVDLADGAPAWGDAGVIVPWQAYQWYGDDRLIRTHRRAAAAWVDYIDAANPDGRWVNRRNGDIGDWLSIEADTPKEVLATAFFAHSADLSARMAIVAGDSAEAARLGEIAARATAAFNDHYVAVDGRIEGDTQTAYALALRFDLLPTDLRAEAGMRLAADVEGRDFHPSVGFVGVPHLLPALSDTGHHEVAYRVLLQRSFPSWGHQIDCGATTMWERWDGWTPEAGFQTPAMNSFNHYAFGAVGEWLAVRVAGIAPDPDQPGFRRALLQPQPGLGLDWARGTFASMRGQVACGWQRQPDGSMAYDAEVPMHGTARLVLPVAHDAEETTPHGPVDDADGVVAVERSPGLVTLDLAPGRHAFTVGPS